MRPKSKAVYYLFGIAFLSFCIFINILDNTPTNWDDPAIFSNPHFQGLTIENLSHALTLQKNATFQPLRDMSYMIDFTFWPEGTGLLIGLHLHNILLYLGMIIACYLFLRIACRALGIPEEKAFFFSLLSTAIYAVHPVHVESVAWLYARKEPLLGLFTFLSLWAFLKARLDKRCVYFLLSALALILAILSKPTAVVLPGVILLLEIMLRVKRQEPISWFTDGLYLLPLAAFAAWQAVRLIRAVR